MITKIETQNCEIEQEYIIRNNIQAKLNCEIATNTKCNNIVLSELIEELNSIKIELQGDSKSSNLSGTDGEYTVNETANEAQTPKTSKIDPNSSSTPNRNIAFKFNKSKKEKKDTNSAGNVPQYPSISSSPRKKIEKLNYKSGSDILEIYKSKYKSKLSIYDVEVKENLLKNESFSQFNSKI